MRTIMITGALVLALGALPAHASTITVTELTANLSPDPVAVNGMATLSVFVQQGMNCTASYSYASKTAVKPVSFAKRNIGSTGHTSWAWKVITKAGAGIAYVTCTMSQSGGSFTETTSLNFKVKGNKAVAQAVPATSTPIDQPTWTEVPSTPFPTDTRAPLPTSTPVPPAPIPPSSTPVPAPPPPTAVPAAPGTSPDAPGIMVEASNLHVDRNGVLPPTPGFLYAVVRVKITNNSQDAYTYNTLDFYVQDFGDGIRRQGGALDTNINNSALVAGVLSPGQWISGDVAFEVPKTETRFYLLWQPGPLDPTVTLPVAQ